MRRAILLSLLIGLPTAAAASAQTFGSGPVENQKTGDVRQQGGGYNPYYDRGTQFESVMNPQTGRFERRSVTVAPGSNRMIARQQIYDPQTGSYTSEAVQQDTFTGQTLMTRRVRNPFTGEQEQQVGMVNPVTGQGYGFIRRQVTDPYTQTIRRDVQQFNGTYGGPSANGFYSNSTMYNPYTGQFMLGYPNNGYRPWP
jgi:hypothetical protein